MNPKVGIVTLTSPKRHRCKVYLNMDNHYIIGFIPREKREIALCNIGHTPNKHRFKLDMWGDIVIHKLPEDSQ